MQTFLSETTFSGSAEVLDKKRLQKQLLEARQIIEILLVKQDARWRNHPAVLMWKGCEFYLYLYIKAMVRECQERDIKTEKNWEVVSSLYHLIQNRDAPYWWDDESLKDRVIITHRARLFIKNPEHYAQYEHWVEPAEEMRCCSHCNYFWPSHWAKNGNKFLITTKQRSK